MKSAAVTRKEKSTLLQRLVFAPYVLWAVLFIGAITFTLSAVGVKVGNVFGEKYKSRAELVGGAILVLLGVKILLEHLNLLPF